MGKHFVSLFSVAFLILGSVIILSETANAQPRRARGRVYTKADVDRVIKRVEERTDDFVRDFNKALDRSRLDGTYREDTLNQRARDLESATDELRREFDRRDTYQENTAEVRRCLTIARDINVAMKNRNFGGDVESSWAKLRYELNTLAKIYRLNSV